ncbi:MAG: Uma2 family endonuclease [Aggregatilineales bacterium]
MALETKIKQPLTLADFEAFINLPENSERTFEFISGEIVEVPSNPFVSEIAGLIMFFIRLFLVQNNMAGHLTGEAGGYVVNGERYAPDVAFISYARQPELARSGYNPNPPELAVEVISDPASVEEQTALRRKLANYLAAGTVVWIVDPSARAVEVYAPGQPAQTVGEGGALSGGAVLPGLSIPVKDIFPASGPRPATASAG